MERSRELYIESNSEKREGSEGGEGESHPHPLPGPGAPKALGALTWQEAAVSSELFPAGKAPLVGVANKDFRGIVGSVGGSQAPAAGHRGSVASPEQAPWHDVVVVRPGTGGLGQIPGSHEVR